MKNSFEVMRELLRVMPRGASKFFLWYSIGTGLLSILDVLALTLITATATIAFSPNPVSVPLLGELSPDMYGALIACVVILFVSKSIAALMFYKFATKRYGSYELEMGRELFIRYATSKWQDRVALSTSDVTRLIDSSVSYAVSTFLLSWSTLPGLVLTIFGVALVLVLAQPLVAVITIVYFGLVSGAIASIVAKITHRLGNIEHKYSFQSATVITEMVESITELTLQQKVTQAESVINKNRIKIVSARSERSFFSILPRYLMEIVLLGGFVVVGGFAYLFLGPDVAASSMLLYVAAGFRLVPALVGLNSSVVQVSAYEKFALDVINNLNSGNSALQKMSPAKSNLPANPQKLKISGVSFRYDGETQNTLHDVELEIPFGSTTALVGPSGSGKSTLVDIILGLSTPQTGRVEVDGIPISDVSVQWQSRIGYIPQSVSLFNGSISQNVALTWAHDYETDRVVNCLRKAHLSEFISDGAPVAGRIGTRGLSLSGGQQQRLGIARALYVNPTVIVMDEATSALDTETESRIVSALDDFKAEGVTLITVAHRLATVRDYDQICYIDAGRILGVGTFDELTKTIPAFRKQASLAGLD